MVQDRYGPADMLELREIPRPEATGRDVLVRVRAASLNPLDWHIMKGVPFFVRGSSGLRTPRAPIRGVDVAGTVEAVGAEVATFRPGDEVFGWCAGAFAEYVKTSETALVAKPGTVSHEQAAAVPVAGFTALQGLRDHGRIQAGQRVLIIGAAGGVGTHAVQIAKSFGTEVTGVCSTGKAGIVRSLGADEVIDYTRHDVTEDKRRYDIVFQLAGTASPAALRRILTANGTLVLSSGEGRFSGIDRIVRALGTSPFVSQRLVTFIANNNHSDLETLADMLAAGTITPVVDRTYALEEVPDAIRYLEAGHAGGKVIIIP